MRMHTDAIIFGGGLSGLTAAHLLSHLGVKTTLLEKGPTVGGANRSYADRAGNVFDSGYHTLDYNRSRLTSLFFRKVLGGNVHKFELKRGLVLRNTLLPYNAPLAEWPSHLREMFDRTPFEDAIGGELTRAKIAAVYGKRFADFAFDEVLPSYPSKKWSLQNGADEADHSGQVYPWFFPRTPRSADRVSETDRYHDRVRGAGRQEVLYPRQGGFAEFLAGIERGIDRQYCEIRTGAADLRFEFAPGTHKLNSVSAGGDTLTAEMYFWCAPFPLLLRTLGIEVKAGAPQKLALGNFTFAGEVGCPYHEILVGDAELGMSRISFPGKIAQTADCLVQVELLYPAGTASEDPEYWKRRWHEGLRKLGVIRGDTDLLEFSLIVEPRGFATIESFDRLSESFRSRFDAAGTNFKVPSFHIGPENINRIVPNVLENVMREALAFSGE
jgi:protoporphyrinogen oxidase